MCANYVSCKKKEEEEKKAKYCSWVKPKRVKIASN